MKTNSFIHTGKSAALALLLTCAAVFSTHAGGPYLRPNQPDPVVVLAPPPAEDSEEAKAELQFSRELCKARTEAQAARAREDANLTLFYFSRVIGTNFAPGKFPKVEALFDEIRKEVKAPVTAAKRHWMRKRPCQVDPSLLFDKPEEAAGYPSGHSTYGTVESLILAELYPAKRDQILAIGQQIGWDRVITGYHYLSDVEAGRVFGRALVHDMMESPGFQQDLAAAKAEVAAAESH